jgi:RNA polymerase sigma-70 factor (ECF subfamily)
MLVQNRDGSICVEDVWEQFNAQLRRFILARVDNIHNAEDILQDVFLKVVTHIHTLNDAARLQSWLYQTTRNVIIDHYRRRPTLHNIPKTLPEPEKDDDRLAMRKIASCLDSMIAQLPEPYRQALILAELEGLTQREVAEQLGLSLSGAKSRVQRARRQLKHLLLECCHFEFDRLGRVVDYHSNREQRSENQEPKIESKRTNEQRSEN